MGRTCADTFGFYRGSSSVLHLPHRTMAEVYGKWELEQRRSFIFTLSYKQSASINNQTATSELGFPCDQRNKIGVTGTILIPFDDTFEKSRPIPVSIQQKSDEYGRSDLLQNWQNGNDFLFLDAADDVADLVTLLKEKDAGSDRSVHFYFPSGLNTGQQTSNHIVVEASGFADRFPDFEKGCSSPRWRECSVYDACCIQERQTSDPNHAIGY